MGERDVEQWLVALGRDVHSPDAATPVGFVGQRRDVIADEELVDELAVLGRDDLRELRRVEAAFVGAGELLREQQVDAVRPVADLFLDPTEVDIELVGRVGHRAEHPETAGPTDLGNDVSTMTEREERELDAEHLAGSAPHAQPLQRTGRRAGPQIPNFSDFHSTGPSDARSGIRPAITVRASPSSARARWAPRQWWMPEPNVMWGVEGSRVMSKVSGSS